VDDCNLRWTWEWLQERFHGPATDTRCPLMHQVMNDNEFTNVFLHLLTTEASYQVAARGVSARVAIDPNDIVNDIMCTVLRGGCRGYTARSATLKTYFKSVIKNQIFLIGRRQIHDQTINVDTIDDVLEDSAPAPCEVLEQAETLDKITDALNEFRQSTTFSNEVLALFLEVIVYQNLSYKDASNFFGIPINEAYQICHRLKQILRELLKKRNVE
jgi:DNA-directed RNA polymerase specialized sigma24 family protein